MSKLYQVRYSVGDKTVAHEHYTEVAAKKDAKNLSKSLGNAMIGEIDVSETGEHSLTKAWEATGGEIGKPIVRDGSAPSHVEVVKTAEDTKVPEGKSEKKPKAPRLSDEEKLAKKRAEAAALVAAIDAGTYVAPARGRKAGTGTGPKTPKDEGERIAKLASDLGVSEDSAKIVYGAQLNAVGRRVRVALAVVDAKGPILASAIVANLNENGKEDRVLDAGDVLAAVNHINFKFSKGEQPWRIIVKPLDNDFSFNLVGVKIEYQDHNSDGSAD